MELRRFGALINPTSNAHTTNCKRKTYNTEAELGVIYFLGRAKLLNLMTLNLITFIIYIPVTIVPSLSGVDSLPPSESHGATT